jgi:hypothetical protein
MRDSNRDAGSGNRARRSGDAGRTGLRRAAATAVPELRRPPYPNCGTRGGAATADASA